MGNRPRAKYKDYTAFTFSSNTGCNTVYVICLDKDGKPHKVFISMGKGGGCARSISCAFAELINKILESGGKIQDAVDALQGHDCHRRNCCSHKIADCLNEWGEQYADTKVD